MPLQNRVTPEGDIVAVSHRGTMYGNRGGCFHRADQTLRPRRYATRQWICCVLAFKNRRRPLMQPGLFTELFFLDEATAFAAGHRPCFECRRADAIRFAELWNAAHGQPGRAAAPVMDLQLHTERSDPQGVKITYRRPATELPDGTMIRDGNQPYLLHQGQAWPWCHAGYGDPVALRRTTSVDVLTPRSTIAILSAGYRPQVHATATHDHDHDHARSIAP